MKFKSVLLSLALGAALLSGCSPKEAPQPQEPQQQEQQGDQAEVATTPSIVNNADAFLNATGSEGTWIIATLSDLTIDKDIVLEGEFTNKDQSARKIALYEQDADRNVTARYTLTAPKLIVRSENAKIQSGTFVGDVYVEANGFQLVDTKIEGNLYFANDELEASATIDETSSVTGVTEIKQAQ